MKISALISFLFLLLFAWDSFAVSLFGGSLKSRLKSADGLLEKSDGAFYGGDFSSASNGYSRAMEKYLNISSKDPAFESGLPAIRAKYCRDQIIQCISNLTGEEYRLEEPEEEDGKAARTAKEAFESLGGNEAEAAQENAAAEDDGGEAELPSYDRRDFIPDFNEARELIERGKAQDAIEILIPMVNFDANNREVRMLLAAARLKNNQADLAAAALEGLRGQKSDLPVMLLLSAAYARQRRYPDALRILDDAVKHSPLDPAAYSNLAWLYLAMSSDKAAAGAYYKRALSLGGERDLGLESAIGAN